MLSKRTAEARIRKRHKAAVNRFKNKLTRTLRELPVPKDYVTLFMFYAGIGGYTLYAERFLAPSLEMEKEMKKELERDLRDCSDEELFGYTTEELKAMWDRKGRRKPKRKKAAKRRA